MKLWQKICISMLLGSFFGLILPSPHWALKTIGDSFLALIHMLILPLVFSSITTGIIAVQNTQKLSRIGIKTLGLYISTTAISVILGVVVGYVIQPGINQMDIAKTKESTITLDQKNRNSQKLFGNIIPVNPIRAFVDGNVVQIIFCSVFFAVAIQCSPKDRVEPLIRLLQSISSVMLELTSIVMKLSPYGVFAIVAWSTASFGLQGIYSMMHFLLFYYGACLFHIFITLGFLIRYMAKVPFSLFIRKSWDALIMAFSTCSSSATLPVAVDCLINKMGVGKSIATFMVPLGTAINMNGAAIYQGMSALFLCGIYGIDLSFIEIMELIAVAICSALGSAGVPGTGLIMLSVVLSSIGVPLEGIALLAGVDRIREMISTVTNITGDIVCCLVVARQEKEIDESILLSPSNS